MIDRLILYIQNKNKTNKQAQLELLNKNLFRELFTLGIKKNILHYL